MKSSSHNLLLHRALQYLGIILIMAAMGGGYWYWKQAQAGVNLNASQEGTLSNGLVGHWTFDGNDISGTTAYDRSGQGNNGTLTNGPTKTIGKVGQGMSFDGTDDYVDLGTPASLNLASANKFTLSAWVYPTSAPNGVGVISEMYNPTNTTVQYELGFNQDNGVISGSKLAVGFYDGSWRIVEDSVDISLNQWAHITGTWDGSTLRLYKDGMQVNSGAPGGSLSSTNFDKVVIGRRHDIAGMTNFFPGKIDEPRIYNRALSAGEIWDLYQMGVADKMNSADSQGDSLEKGMVGYWKLDDASGTSATDASGNSNTGTLTNGPTWTTGRIGGATNFDGTDDYIDAGDPSIVDFGSGNFVLSAWIKRASNDGRNNMIISKDSSNTSGRQFHLFVTSTGTIRFSYNTSDANQVYLDTAVTVTDTNWHHVFGQRVGNSLEIYLDGILSGSGTTGGTHGSMQATATNLRFGQRPYTGNTNEFNGNIDEVRIYNRALSADEIATLYKTTTPDNPDTGLVGYWPFNGPDISGTTAYDRSGKGNHGTLTNSPTKTEGKVGQALSFNGTNQGIAMGVNKISPKLNGVSQVTVSSWIKPTVYPGTGVRARAVSVAMGEGISGVLLGLYDGGKIEIGGRSVTSDSFQNATYAYPRLHEWHHVTGILDILNDKIYVYLDGALVVTQSVSFANATYTNGTPTTSGDSLGYFNHTSGLEYFPGSIDEPRIYNRALSASEIWDLYQMGASDKVNSAESQMDPLEKGLVGYWKLDDGSGTTAADASGNSNTGTLTNGPTWTTGQIGGAVNFDGTNDYVTLQDSTIFDPGGTATWCHWLYPAANQTGKGMFVQDVSSGRSTTTYKWLSYITSNSGLLVFYVRIGGVSYPVTGPNGYYANSWHHLCATFDKNLPSARLKIYINGSLAGSSDVVNGNIDSGDFPALGQWVANYYQGKIDEVRIYNRALSADEVAKLYKTTVPDDPDTGLVGYWSFNGQDISGTTAYDRSGKGNHGTLVSSPTKTIGKVGQALSFNGTSQYVDVPYANLDFERTDSFSLSTWFKSDDFTPSGGYQTFLGRLGGGGPGTGITLSRCKDAIASACNANGVAFHILNNWTANGIMVMTATNSFPPDVWTHVVATYDGSSSASGVKVYKNGVSQSLVTNTNNLSASIKTNVNWRIGDDQTNDYTKGKIDELRIYSRVLSQSEVTALYNAGR